MTHITIIIIVLILAISILLYRYINLKYIKEIDIDRRFKDINFLATNIIREINETEFSKEPIQLDSIKGDLQQILKNTINYKN